MSGVRTVPQKRFTFVASLMLLLCVSTRVIAASWDLAVPPAPDRNLTRAEFRLWTDDRGGSPPPVAVLVLLTGWNGDGRGLVDAREWQAFARENRVALLGAWFESDLENEQEPPYHVATQGGGDALLQALGLLAEKAGQPRLTDLPLLFWGHSAGGQFGYGMACHVPERVVAFVAIKGGIYHSKPQPGTYRVPGLFIVGEEDHPQRAMNITWLFETGRVNGAPWCIAFEPGGGHDLGRSQSLALPFLRAALARRVPPGMSRLGPIADSKAWCGLRSTLEIREGSPSTRDQFPRTVWLPDIASAIAWASFSAGQTR